MPMIIRPYTDADQASVLYLWQACGLIRPWNNALTDIFRKQGYQDELFLVAESKQEIVGVVMGGYDGHRGWANYLAVDPDYQLQGIARLLMRNLEQRLIAKGCPKIQLLVRKDNPAVIDFYEKLDYEHVEVLCLGKRLIED